jgi:hypothetical protein
MRRRNDRKLAKEENAIIDGMNKQFIEYVALRIRTKIKPVYI